MQPWYNFTLQLTIRLEKRIPLNEEGIYIDILISTGSKIVAIETKYKTKNISISVYREEFNLKNQSAQDCSRYDFIKDISRIEECLMKYQKSYGFAVFLTNDSSYWTDPRKKDTNDKDFRIHEGRTIQGKLNWKEGTSEGTMKGRSAPIVLNEKYRLNWKDYSDLKNKNGKFRYVLVEVTHSNHV